MRPRGIALLITGGLVQLTASSGNAQELNESVQIHGFVSQGFIKTTENNYLAESERGSFEFTEVGINFTSQVTDELRMGIQLFARDLGPLGNYAPQFDWYYLDYRFWDWLGIRVGRTKLPWGLYNEANDVDAGRVPVLLPQSLYPVSNRELLFAQTGGELYGLVPLGAAGQIEYRAYGGTIFLNTAETSVQLREFDVPYLVGGRVLWLPPVEGLRLGGSAQALRLDFEFVPTAEQLAQYDMAGQLPDDFSGTVTASIPAWLWIASVEFQAYDLLFAAEYGRTYVETESNLLIPSTRRINEGYYAMVSYQVAPWFAPGVYYSALFEDVGSGESSPSTYQHDVALTLRYDLNSNWLVKVEGHYMHGTASLSSALNDNQPLDDLKADWGVLLLKTTGYF